MIKQQTINVTKNQSTLTDLPVLFNELKIDTLSVCDQELITSIEAVLPQTQCGLCNHSDGCLPYAYAIVQNNEMPNKCIPGGQAVTDKITTLLQQKPLKVMPSKWETNLETNRPQEMRAVIREDDCIGCTKCVPACPVDAIIGTGKHMHSIFTDLCTGCELCIAPCPVDCIDLVPIERFLNHKQREKEQSHLRERYHTHLDRVYEQMQDKHNSQPVVSVVESKLSNSTHTGVSISQVDAKHAIATAKLRTKIKKLEKQLIARDDETKRALLQELQQELSSLEHVPI